MLWIPVAFVCLVNGECSFQQAYVERYLQECEEVNRKAVIRMRDDKTVMAYDVTCIQVLLKESGNATNEELQPGRDDQERHGSAPGYGQYPQ